MNLNRANEAIATGANVVATACPYCIIMLDDAVKTQGEEVTVMDISQVIELSLKSESV